MVRRLDRVSARITADNHPVFGNRSLSKMVVHDVIVLPCRLGQNVLIDGRHKRRVSAPKPVSVFISGPGFSGGFSATSLRPETFLHVFLTR
ncbi:hypothetical protein RRG08_054423 [Elysia crispata]|uniref:Uncharacterized protein n=1 Tax=Elysia crispata TaxID=231223 RepID=A0AAE1AVH0_9GAST|nr:hypothetical protein RRG08_054423 [Elysia crispata]